MAKEARPLVPLFAAGFVTFSLLYSVQPLLPLLAREYGLSPSAASLSLSLATAALAVAMPLAAVDSDLRGRKPLMVASLVLTSLLSLLVPLAPGFASLLAARLLVGAALAGVPAIAMTYVAEEVPPAVLGRAMGIYVAGTALGGMSGRIAVGLLEERLGWRGALFALALANLIVSAWFARALPPSTRFRPSGVPRLAALRRFGGVVRRPGLFPVLGIPAFLMAGFVSLYNYATFHLAEPPWNLTTAQVGWIFLCYLAGMGGSASLGRLADRAGRGTSVRLGLLASGCGLALTLSPLLAVHVAGIALFTFGYFGAHGTASGWAGERSGEAKAAASAVYLLSYYFGSSVGGWAGGLFWQAAGWNGVAAWVAGCLGCAALLSLRAERTPVPLVSA